MALHHWIKPKYKTRNDAIIARLRAEAGADAPCDPIVSVKKKAAELAYLMALVHGGDWQTRIDHQEGLVIVARRGRRQTL